MDDTAVKAHIPSIRIIRTIYYQELAASMQQYYWSYIPGVRIVLVWSAGPNYLGASCVRVAIPLSR